MQTGRVLLRANDKAGIHEQVSHVIRSAGYNLADSVGKSVDGHYFLRSEFCAEQRGRISITATEFERRFREALKPLNLQDMFLRVVDSDRKKRTAVLVSTKFYCLEELLHHRKAKDMSNIEIVSVISNCPAAEEVVKGHEGVEFHYVNAGDREKDGDNFINKKRAAEERIVELTKGRVDFYTLAKWHRVLLRGGAMLSNGTAPILSVHPSLLPSFPGNAAVRDAHESGAKVSGATAHLVTPEDEDIDKGPKIVQISREVGNLGKADFKKEVEFAEREAIYKAVRIVGEDRFITFRDSPTGTRKTYVF